MTLWDMLNSCVWSNYVCIYATNAYDENICLHKGRVLETRNDEKSIFLYLERKVEVWGVIDNVILLKIKSFKYNKRLKTQYSEEYVKKWDERKPETRPYQTGSEVIEEVTEYAQKLKGTSDDK